MGATSESNCAMWQNADATGFHLLPAHKHSGQEESARESPSRRAAAVYQPFISTSFASDMQQIHHNRQTAGPGGLSRLLLLLLLGSPVVFVHRSRQQAAEIISKSRFIQNQLLKCNNRRTLKEKGCGCAVVLFPVLLQLFVSHRWKNLSVICSN